MKHKLNILLSAAAVSVLAGSASAQGMANTNSNWNKSDRNQSEYNRTESPRSGSDYSRSPSDRSAYNQDQMNHPRMAQLNGATKASDLIGMTVNNYQNEKLGKIDDLAVDLESGRVVQVILSSGGFLGIGDSLTAVPPGALHQDDAEKVIQLDATRDKLKSAPRFDTAKWEENTKSNRVEETYAYFGQEPYCADMGPNSPADVSRNMDGTVKPDGARTVDLDRKNDMARNAESANYGVSTRTVTGSWSSEHHQSVYAKRMTGLDHVQSAKKLMGTTVQNLENENIGQVQNLMVDLSSGRIVAVIVSSGGFLGMGDELSAVPPTAFNYSSQNDTLNLDATKDSLARAPHFRSTDWPDLGEPGYVGGLYRAYHVEPYFTTDSMSAVNTSRSTVRDHQERELTPLDQGNNQADLNTTAQIRKAIRAEQNMSINAQNVKIITKDGQVTLRGKVNSTEEKRQLGEIAKRIASSENVHNQLEVTGTSNTSSNY